VSDAWRSIAWFAGFFAVLLAVQLAAPLEPTADLHSSRLYARMALGRMDAGVTPTVTTPKPLATLVAVPAELLGAGETFHRVVAAAVGALALTLAVALAETPLAALALAMTPAFCDDLLALGSELWAVTLVLALMASWRRPAAAAGLLLAFGLLRPEAWLLSAILLASSWLLPPARPLRVAALVGLAAPLLWWAGDALLFGGAFFSTGATRLYQTAIALEAPPASARALAWDLLRLFRSLGSRGGPALVLLALLPWCPRARRDQLALVLAAAASFLIGAVVLRARGYPVFARFLDPVVIAGLVLATGTLRALLTRWPRQRAWVEVSLALLLLFAGAPARVAQWGVLRDRRATTDAAVAAVRERAAGQGTWLVDNDLASLLVAERVLAPPRVINLQRALLERPWPEPLDGIVFDDRFHFATIGDSRLFDLVRDLRERVRLDAGLVRVLTRP
jgi:hypothetical protein